MGRTVRVTDREQHAFVVIDRRTLEDERLSWAARGVIGYLLAKPDDWDIRVEDLRKHGDLGRDGIYAVLKELERYGYLKRIRCRDARGYFSDIDTTIFEVPVPDLPDTAEPDTVQPDPGEPYPANPTLLSNKYTKEPVNQVTTTTTATEQNLDDVASGGDLVFPKALSSGEIEEARRKLEGLSNPLAQQLLDELSARLQSGAIHGSPLAYLRGLVKRAWGGEFTPEAGVPITNTRVHIRTTDAIRARAQSAVSLLPEPDPDNPLVQRIEAIRTRVNGSNLAVGGDPDASPTERTCSLG